MEKRVGLEEARKTLGNLVNEVTYQGARVILTKKGRAVAEIIEYRQDEGDAVEAELTEEKGTDR